MLFPCERGAKRKTRTYMHKKEWRRHTAHTYTHTHLQTGKLQLVYNKKTPPNIIQNKKKNKLQKKLVLFFPAIFIDWNFSYFVKASKKAAMGAHFSVSLFFFMLRAFSVSYTLVRKFIKGNMLIFLSFLDL